MQKNASPRSCVCDVLAEAAAVVAERLAAGRLDAGEDAGLGLVGRHSGSCSLIRSGYEKDLLREVCGAVTGCRVRYARRLPPRLLRHHQPVRVAEVTNRRIRGRRERASTLSRMAVTGAPELLIVMSGRDRRAGPPRRRAHRAGRRAAHVTPGREATVIGAIGDARDARGAAARGPARRVEQVVPILKPYKLVCQRVPATATRRSRRRAARTIGGGNFAPDRRARARSRSREQTARDRPRACKAAGATILRGGAFKPRTSPYAFQGLGEEGLRSWPRRARRPACRSSPR